MTWLFLTTYRRQTLMVLASMFVASIAESVGIVSLLPLLETITNSDPEHASATSQFIYSIFDALHLEVSLAGILALVAGGLILKTALYFFAVVHIGYTSSQFATDLRLKLIRAISRAQWSYFSRQPIGQHAASLSTETNRAAATYIAFCSLLATFSNVAILATSAFLIDWKVGAVALVVGGAMILVLRGFLSMARDAGYRITRFTEALLSRITDGLQTIKPLKAMAEEAQLTAMLEHEVVVLNEAQKTQILAKNGVIAGQDIILLIVIAVGAYLAIGAYGQPVATLLVMAMLFHRSVGAIGRVQKDYQSILNSEAGLIGLLSAISDAEAAEEQRPGSRTPTLAHELRFNDVSFAYDKTPIVTGACLNIPAGQVTVLIGPSGAGKTTLIDLVCRLIEPSKGQITVDGVPLDEINVRAWRSLLGYVPQETTLFHDTVSNNISLGDPAIDRSKIEQSLRRADAWDFIAGLPNGMDTVVGERGSRFSGGQRQRLAIARALVRKPRLLILDEATVALDPQTEESICDTLRALAGDLTIFAISHQPAILKIADNVYEIENGCIRAQKAVTDAVRRTS